MTSEPHEPLDREDREDAPFLDSPDSGRPSDAKPEIPAQASRPNVSSIAFRLRVILCLMVLAVEVGFAFLEGPMVRILEAIACRQHYLQADPSKIAGDGQVPEKLCKLGEIQAELAAVKGYHMFFDGLLSALLAIPYGLLADRRGRKPTLVLSLPGFALNTIITVTVMWFSDIFPLRAVWLSSLSWLLGGGPVVAAAIIWTMMADVTTEPERATIFFQFGIAFMGADFASSAVSSWLMTMNPWVPLTIGYGIILGGLLFTIMLPETKHAMPSQPPESSHVELSDLSAGLGPKHHSDELGSYHEESDFHANHDHSTTVAWSLSAGSSRPMSTKWRANYRFYIKPYLFILNRKPVLLLLSAFLVYRLSRGSSWFLTQYISTRYNWTLAAANLLHSCRPAVSIPLFLFGLPWIKERVLHPRRTPTEKDLWLARGSIFCLTLGTLGIGLSPSIAALIPSMVLQTLGSGFVFLTRSIITTLVERDQTARLFTVIEILQAVGNVIASLSITTVFQYGLRLGGAWIGLAWMMTSSLFCLVGLAIWRFRLPPASAEPDFVVGEFDEDA